MPANSNSTLKKPLKKSFKKPALKANSPQNLSQKSANSHFSAQNAPDKAFFTQIQSGKFKGKKLILPNLSTTRSTKSRVKDCVFSVLRFELAGKIFIEVFGGSGAMALEALSNGAKEVFIIEKDDKAYQIACKNAQSINSCLTNAQNLALNSHTKNAPNLSSQAFANAPAKVFCADSFELLPKLVGGEFGDLSAFSAKNAPNFQAFRNALDNKNAPDNEKTPQNTSQSTRENSSFLQNAPKSQISSQSPIIAYFDPPFHLRNGFDDIYERIFSLINSLQSSNLELFIIEHSSKIPMPEKISTFYQSKAKKFGNTTLTFYRKR